MEEVNLRTTPGLESDNESSTTKDTDLEEKDNNSINGQGNLLPDIEEYKTSSISRVKTGDPNHRGARWPVIVLIVLIVVILGAVFITIGVVVGTKKPAEDGFEEVAAAVQSTDVKRLRMIKGVIMDNNWSSYRELNSPGTPQFQAVTWVATKDDRQVDLQNWEEIKERYIMAVVYLTLSEGEGGWKRDLGFRSAKHVCDWYAVYFNKKVSVTDSDHKRTRVGLDCNEEKQITKIFLPYFKLSGMLPSEIGFLDKLAVIDMSGNDISGEIPDSLSRLKNLKDLNMHDNDLIGTIPSWFPQFSELEVLNLRNNNLVGPIPDKIQNLTSLKYLDLSGNQLIDDGLTDIDSGNNVVTGENVAWANDGDDDAKDDDEAWIDDDENE